jgi:tetratricopeptide (TPR) repeat protein
MYNIRSLFVSTIAAVVLGGCATGGPPGDSGKSVTSLADADSLASAADAATARGDYAGAKSLYDTALEIDPGSAVALRGLASLYDATNDPASSLHYLERLNESPASDASDRVDLANALVRAGRGGEAVSLLESSLQASGSGDEILLRNLGLILLARGRDAEAITYLERAVEVAPHPESRSALANALFDAERYDEAASVLEAFLEQEPDDFDANMQLGYIFSTRGDFEAALPRYRAAVDANPNSIDARVSLGRTLEQVGRIDSAIRVYDTALEMRGLEREMEPVILAQANLLNKRGKYSRTIELVEAASAVFPETPGLACARGMALAGEGRYDDAVAAFARATGDPKWSEFANAQIRRIQSLR